MVQPSLLLSQEEVDFLKKLYKIEFKISEIITWQANMMSDVQTQEQASLPADLSKQWAEKQFEMFKLKKARQFILNDDLIVEREKVNLDE